MNVVIAARVRPTRLDRPPLYIVSCCLAVTAVLVYGYVLATAAISALAAVSSSSYSDVVWFHVSSRM